MTEQIQFKETETNEVFEKAKRKGFKLVAWGAAVATEYVWDNGYWCLLKPESPEASGRWLDDELLFDGMVYASMPVNTEVEMLPPTVKRMADDSLVAFGSEEMIIGMSVKETIKLMRKEAKSSLADMLEHMDKQDEKHFANIVAMLHPASICFVAGKKINKRQLAELARCQIMLTDLITEIEEQQS